MKRERHYYVYIMTNEWETTLYIGMTNNLIRRVREHKEGIVEGFTKRYHVKKLVYYEAADTAYAAIAREKQLKNWHREWKLNLIRTMNPTMTDLYPLLLKGDAETSSA